MNVLTQATEGLASLTPVFSDRITDVMAVVSLPWPFQSAVIKSLLAQSGTFSVELHFLKSHFGLVQVNHETMSGRVPLCIQGCDSSMWVRAALRATGPEGPLQDNHNGSPRPDAIAEIPTRNQGALVWGHRHTGSSPTINSSISQRWQLQKATAVTPQWMLDVGHGHQG